MKKEPKITDFISYDELRQDPSFPKSRWGFIKWMFKNMWQGIKGSFPKNILIILGSALFYWLFNLFFLSYVNDSCFFGNGRFRNSSILPYLFGGLIYKGNRLKGFDVMPGEITTWFYNMTLMMSLIWLISGIIRRIRTKNFIAPLKDIFRIPSLQKGYRASSAGDFTRLTLVPMGIAFLLGFLLKSPFTIGFLALFLLLSFGQGNESPHINMLFIYQGAKNLGSKKPQAIVCDGDAALPLFGLGIGFLLDFILVLILWNTFNYSFWSRLIFSLLIGSLLIFIGFGGSIQLKNKSVKAIGCFLLFTGVVSLLPIIALAHDGGWLESGKNLKDWLQNPGTTLMPEVGVGGVVGLIFGWAANMGLAGVLDAFTGGVGSAAVGTAAGAGQGPLELGLAAYETALSRLGPMGKAFGNAWRTTIDVLGGADRLAMRAQVQVAVAADQVQVAVAALAWVAVQA